MNVSALEKVELHLHLDCSLSYTAVCQIDPTVTRETYEQTFIAPAKCSDLVDFLARVPRCIALMQTEEQLRLAVFDLFAQLAADNVIYAEIRFAPLLHTERGLTPYEVVAAVETAAAQAIEASGIEARLILCTLRHYNEEQSMATVLLVEQFRGGLAAAFDLAADEKLPIDAHVAAFQYAREKGIPCTAHAGEARGAESVWETLERLQPARLGHGVRSSEDPLLLEHLRREQIHCEICPTCNVQTDIYATHALHPIDTLYHAGLSVGINTDARTTANISLNEEYAKLQQSFGWNKEAFYQCNRYALQAAFVEDGKRQALLARLEAGYHTTD